MYNEQSDYYETFYANGGWKYSFLREWRWHRRHFIRRFGIPRGSRVLEAACGAGFHTHLLNRMGLRCVGVDSSETGIRWAREHYPRWTYLCGDVREELPLDLGSFDVVMTHGCSLYHYDLASPLAMQTTPRLMSYLRPGGLFLLIIATDLSGRRDPEEIWQNTLDDYRSHFAASTPHYSVDWHKGMAICAAWRPPAADTPTRRYSSTYRSTVLSNV